MTKFFWGGGLAKRRESKESLAKNQGFNTRELGLASCQGGDKYTKRVKVRNEPPHYLKGGPGKKPGIKKMGDAGRQFGKFFGAGSRSNVLPGSIKTRKG